MTTSLCTTRRTTRRAPRRALTTLALAAALAPLAASAQVELKYASAAPPGSLFAKQIERLAADIAAETGGKVKVNPFHNAQLGGEADVIGQIVRGRVEMGGFAAAALSLQTPEIGLLQLPFMFDSTAQRDCVLDNHAKPIVVENLAKKGLHFVAWGESGVNQIIGKKAYPTPADVKGAKVAHFPGKVISEFWRHVGANPVPTSSADLASGLQTGLLDAMATVPVYYIPSGLNKIAPTLTKVDLSAAMTVNVVSKSVYDKWPADLRAAFDRGAAKTPTAQVRSEIRALNEQLLKGHKDAGGTLVDVTPEQRALWQKDLAPYYASIVKDLGEPGAKLFAALEAGKKVCAK